MEFLEYVLLWILVLAISFIVITFISKVVKQKIKKEQQKQIIAELSNLDNNGLFRKIKRELEKKFKRNGFEIAFMFNGNNVSQTLEWLELLESKDTRIIASNFDKMRVDNNIETVKDCASIFLEDENGVIYIIFTYMDDDASKQLEQFKVDICSLDEPYVICNNSIAKLKIVDASDVFIPKDNWGDGDEEHKNKSEVIITPYLNLEINFYWRKDKNMRYTAEDRIKYE